MFGDVVLSDVRIICSGFKIELEFHFTFAPHATLGERTRACRDSALVFFGE